MPYISSIKLKEMTQSTKLRKDIEAAKRKLINKAKRTGLWENFGQDEVRKIEDKHDNHALTYGDAYERSMAAQIRDFDNWCMNFNDADLKRAKL